MKKIITLIAAGIMLISIDGLSQSVSGVAEAKNFRSVFIDKDNIKWFLTEAGMVSFDGKKWTLQNKNKTVPTGDLKDFAYANTTEGNEVLIASAEGVTVASLPLKGKSEVTALTAETTPIVSNNVIKLVVGKEGIRWFGTDKGVSAMSNKKWFTPDYEDMYPSVIFEAYPITSMATNKKGDSLYVGTAGAGIARIFRNEVDVISGASVYAQWGPIILPSDNVYSILIAADGTKWFGTDLGLAKHTGDDTLDNWTVFSTAEGLVNDFVQALAEDKKGKIWIGTKGGISVYDGSAWTSYTTTDGLSSNNILCIAVDNSGVVWIGTDNGAMSFNNGKFISYK